GDGTFRTAVTYVTAAGSKYIAMGDFNGDGAIDLVTANETANTISLLLGNGDGTFLPATNLTVGTGPTTLAVGDLNGDGFADLVAANYGAATGTTITVLPGKGDGTFA